MSKHYQSPPILEAVCEFKFQPQLNRPSGIPDLIYEKIKTQFPQREQEPTQDAKTKFRRADGSALLQVSPKLLAINQLRPYPAWSPFKQMILEAYSLYREIAHPASTTRLGLRYINQIEIPGTKVEIRNFLHGCPEGYHKLFLSTEFPFEAENENLVMILAHVPHQEGDFSRFYLDLDYGAFPNTAMEQEAIASILERAHDRIEQIFETSLTDETRHLFGEIKKTRTYPKVSEQTLAPQAGVHEVQAPYVTPAATPSPAISSKPSTAETNEMSTTGVDSSAAVAFYRDRVLELGNKAGHWEDAEAHEAERWENLELALGVEKDIVFKEPDARSRIIKARVHYVGREKPVFYNDWEDD
jgi:uncharacterized protein (TIGR04255 family)